MRIIDHPNFIKIATVGIILTFGYPSWLVYIGADRFIDGALNIWEMTWLEIIIIWPGFFMMWPLLLSAHFHAKQLQKTGWAIFCLLAWPLAYVYAFKYGMNKYLGKYD